ncbi:hypothetical protein [Pedobacter insulae]|uniref:Uncharacterized protein n=1 Tax=Pedobacter insulae TaxID=414048 RepID=A0A1I2TXA4_9SPHI|nr:hypothetical protein [Pedobacter insulae]SFG68007.1 hypothetical protein SAMN04489864_101575 [Pedobacter insulae]
MKRELFLAFLVSVALATSCKKSLKEIKTSTIELGEIKQHIVNS